MKVQRCESCTYYKKINGRYAYSFCNLVNKRCLEVKPLECDDARLTVEMKEILKRILKRKSADEYDNDKTGTADTPKPGQTDPA